MGKFTFMVQHLLLYLQKITGTPRIHMVTEHLTADSIIISILDKRKFEHIGIYLDKESAG